MKTILCLLSLAVALIQVDFNGQSIHGNKLNFSTLTADKPLPVHPPPQRPPTPPRG